MNDTHDTRTLVTKVLAVIGFIATIAAILSLVVKGLERAPGAFASLASVAERVNTYRPLHELTIATEKTVVNSGESFQISWTNVRQNGEYHFSYTCDSGVSLEVRGEGGTIPMKCTDILTLPETAHGLFLAVHSDNLRFADTYLTVTFKDKRKSEELKNTTKVTVVNAAIPARDEATDESVAPNNQQADAVRQTNADLKITMLGSGRIRDGVFSFSSTFDSDNQNAIRFDVKNVGTNISDVWNFTAILPNGERYTSPMQVALRPGDHIEFTLGFFLGDERSPVSLSVTTHSKSDVNSTNNTTVLSTPVKD